LVSETDHDCAFPVLYAVTEHSIIHTTGTPYFNNLTLISINVHTNVSGDQMLSLNHHSVSFLYRGFLFGGYKNRLHRI